MDILPPFNTQQEINKIVALIQETLRNQNIHHVVLGISGGIDSTTSMYLLQKSLPKESIHLVHMPYFHEDKDALELLKLAKAPEENKHIISIKSPVDVLATSLGISKAETIRLANCMARIRMITLFDLAKKIGGLVVGTENRSEHLLGYYTRFGDEASDIEPIRHLYKTQVYEIAKSLGVPDSIINKHPTAGLWSDQTDEKEFGFSYKEADVVLHLYFDKNLNVVEIEKKGFPNVEKIISYAKKNEFKHHTPYTI